MKEFILNNRLSLLGLIFGGIVGIYTYFTTPYTYKHRVIYEYKLSHVDSIPNILKSDTFFIYSNTPIRNYISSYADTISKDGIRRSELIIYHHQQLTEPFISKNYLFPISNQKVSYVGAKIDSKKRVSNALIIYPLTGLFLSMIIHLSFLTLSLRKKK